MRRIEPFLAASFQRGVGRNKRPVFEDADLVGENVPFELVPRRCPGICLTALSSFKPEKRVELRTNVFSSLSL